MFIHLPAGEEVLRRACRYLRTPSSVQLHLFLYIVALFGFATVLDANRFSRLFLGLWLAVLILHMTMVSEDSR